MKTDHLTEEHQRFLQSIVSDERSLEQWAHGRRELAKMHGKLPVMQLGIRQPRHDPQVALGDHLSAQADPPARCHRGLWDGYADVLLNDQLADCGPASGIHGFEGIDHAAGNQIEPFEDEDAEVFYSEEGGYVPGDPSTDQGSDNSEMFRKMENPGILCKQTGKRRTLAGTVFVDITNPVEMRVAIAEFAVVWRAFNMPLSAQGQRVWDVVGNGKTGNSKPGGWGGHDVVAHAYDEDWIDDNSWGIWIPASTAYDRVYGLQAIVGITPSMMNRTGTSPTGLNYDSLMSEFRKFVAVPSE